jgi:hypothetical protein
MLTYYDLDIIKLQCQILTAEGKLTLTNRLINASRYATHTTTSIDGQRVFQYFRELQVEFRHRSEGYQYRLLFEVTHRLGMRRKRKVSAPNRIRVLGEIVAYLVPGWQLQRNTDTPRSCDWVVVSSDQFTSAQLLQLTTANASPPCLPLMKFMSTCRCDSLAHALTQET